MGDNREIGRNTGKWQFTGTEDGANRAFMLNSDFGLLYDLELNADGEAQCSVEQGSANMCSDAPTASAMRAYQGNTAAWVTDFYTALKKLQSAGSATLTSGCLSKFIIEFMFLSYLFKLKYIYQNSTSRIISVNYPASTVYLS